MNLKLSIIIPVYNVEKYIAKSLESVLEQGLNKDEFEVIVVSDGSTDGSFKIAQEFAKKYDQFKLIEKENGGIGSARNCGLDIARGKYVYFLDSDDYLLPNSLITLIEISDKHNLDIITFISKSFSSSSTKNTEVSNSSNEENQLSAIMSGEEYVANKKYRSEAWSYMTNLEFLRKTEVRFIEKRYLEDVIFSLKLFLEAKRMAHLNWDTHRYRISPGSAMQSRKPEHYLKIIRDLQYAVLCFEPIIKKLEEKKSSVDCLIRVKDRQRSILFFSMVRMFYSTMKFDEVKLRMNEMMTTSAYPFNFKEGKDYKGFKYQTLYSLFKNKHRFFFFYRTINPVLKLRYKFSNPA